MLEIERRYLLKSLPLNFSTLPYTIIADRKILTPDPHPQLRLRRLGDKLEFTKKYPKHEGQKAVMIEETINLNENEYNILATLPALAQTKRRYVYKHDGYTWEIDLWLEDLLGLAKAEIEFASEADFKKFVMPDFCLCDVTEEDWLAGGNLAGKKYTDLAERLAKLGYDPKPFTELLEGTNQ